MPTYVYCWEVSLRDGIDVEIRVTAESAPAAPLELIRQGVFGTEDDAQVLESPALQCRLY